MTEIMTDEIDITRCTKCSRSFCHLEGSKPSKVCGTCNKKKKKSEPLAVAVEVLGGVGE